MVECPEIKAVEVVDEIYKCPHCNGYILDREERTYDENENILEEQKWVEHWDELPSWYKEDYPVKVMDMFSNG